MIFDTFITSICQLGAVAIGGHWGMREQVHMCIHLILRWPCLIMDRQVDCEQQQKLHPLKSQSCISLLI